MLKKLLKYDMQQIYRVWWITAVSVISASLVGAFALRAFTENITKGTYPFISAIGMLIGMFSVIGVISSIAITSLLAQYRFYKNFYTDEGYLTFTLPASRKLLLFSKTLNTFIWETAHVILIAICSLIYFIIVPPSTEDSIINPIVFEAFGKLMSTIWKTTGAWFILYIFEFIILAVCTRAFSIILVELCITVGSIIAKKYKLLVAIGIYYLVNGALSFAAQIIMTLSMSFTAPGLSYILEKMSATAAHAALAVLLLIVVAIISAISLVLYFVTLDKIERKLNLA